MMLMPRRNFDLFDDFFDDGFFKGKQNSFMKTDIKETADKYILDIDMPGFSKENIKLSLNNGYLEISANVEKEENEDKEYIRRERFYGQCSRSFYVGEDVDTSDIDAEFKNGILTVEIPKKEKNEVEQSKQIEIKWSK